MPSLSGLHMWRTISTGHSSRSSSSISSSSGKRFLAKSCSDFKLSFRVFFAIMVVPLFHQRALLFANLVGQLGQEFQDVGDNSDVGHTEDGSLGVLVDGDHEGIALDAGQMLERTADAAGHIDLGLDGFAGGAHLPGFLQPLGVDHRTRAAHRAAHRFGQFLGDGDVFLLLDAASDGDQNVVLGDIDIAGFGGDGLQVTASGGQSANSRRLVDHRSASGSAFRRLECARTDVDHRAGREIAADMRADRAAEFLAHDFERLPSMPRCPTRRSTYAAFSLIESPGERSTPKCACGTSTMLPGGRTLTRLSVPVRHWDRPALPWRSSRPRRKSAQDSQTASRSAPQPVTTAVGACGGVDLLRRSQQFRRGIVRHAILMYDVSENASH